MGKYFGTDGFRGEANVTLTVDYDLQDVGDRYKADVPCLLKLKDLVGNEISISKGVDKLAFIRLKDALLEAIRRCEGKSDTLPPM